MPEMEKGRPPENKRSRKPAHPVKREINQEMKTFAESTMNELLGWYGYDKVELRDSEANEIRNYRERRQQVSVLKENSLPKPKAVDAKGGHSILATKTAERESASVPSSSSSSSSPSSSLTSPVEHKSAPVIVPLIKPSAVEDVQNVQIVCVWCQKEGVKRYSLCMGSELKSFCSEKCFAACRRAYFKRNKARDEDLHGGQSPQHCHTEDSQRLVLKVNNNVRVCDWCKHIRHTKEYLDFGSGEERLQFCSTKCLNQYKMDVFYREARAALTSTSSGSSPGQGGQEARPESAPVAGANGAGHKLLTPESWSGSSGVARETSQRNASPRGITPVQGSAASSCISPSTTSSSKAVGPGLRSLERPAPPPPEGLSHASPRPPPPAPPPPHPQHHPPHHHHHPHHRPPLEHMPFIRPPLHAQGLKSPLANPHPRHPAPPSSPIHRPPHSPHHLQPAPAASSSNVNPNPGLVHPFPGAYFPGLHSPPLNMMGHRGPVPMMNYGGLPSYGPLFPQPTMLVPYPVIIPFPVPIPIPVPFPVPAKASPEVPSHGGVIQPVPDLGDRGGSRPRARPRQESSPGVHRPPPPPPFNSLGGRSVRGLPCSPGDPYGSRDSDWVKSERPFPSPTSASSSAANSGASSPGNSPGPEGQADSKPPERQVIQRTTQVKLEPSAVLAQPPNGEPVSPSSPQCHPSPSVLIMPPGRSPPLVPPGQRSPVRRPPAPPDPKPEEVKENSCSALPDPGRLQGDTLPSEEPPAVVGEVGEDPHLPDEDHAYALPTAPKPVAGGGVTPTNTTPITSPINTTTTAAAPLLLPKLRDKGALRSPPSVPGDLEPPLKRRCLRVRDQNK